MSTHTVTVSWQRGSHPFLDNKYSRLHRWRFDGGLDVAGSSSPHVVPLPYSDALAVDPEEAFVASVSSCHMLWFLSIAVKRKFCVDSYTDEAAGTMGRNASGKVAVTAITLRPKVAYFGERVPSDEETRAMHHEAHDECFIANSVLTQINVEPVAV